MTKDLSLHDETHLKVLRLLEATPNINQRKLAETLGVSLGKTNFCLNALLDKGLVKIENFRTSTRKLNYAYLLTPAGIAEKTALTARFLKRKTREYELLKAEIELLQEQVAKNKGDGTLYNSLPLNHTANSRIISCTESGKSNEHSNT